MKRVGGLVLLTVVCGLPLAGVEAGAPGAPDVNLETCFNDVGCAEIENFKPVDLEVLSCDNLWQIRNQIFKSAGLCFKTPRAIAQFGNAGCLFDEEPLVPLNDYQRYNTRLIRDIESRKRC